MALWSVSHMLYREALHCSVLHRRATCVGVATRTYKPNNVYPIYLKLQYECMLALYGLTMHVTSGTIPSSAVLRTEKLAAATNIRKRLWA